MQLSLSFCLTVPSHNTVFQSNFNLLSPRHLSLMLCCTLAFFHLSLDSILESPWLIVLLLKMYYFLKWQFINFLIFLYSFHIYCFDWLLWVDTVPQLTRKFPSQNISRLLFWALWIPNKYFFMNHFLFSFWIIFLE